MPTFLPTLHITSETCRRKALLGISIPQRTNVSNPQISQKELVTVRKADTISPTDERRALIIPSETVSAFGQSISRQSRKSNPRISPARRSQQARVSEVLLEAGVIPSDEQLAQTAISTALSTGALEGSTAVSVGRNGRQKGSASTAETYISTQNDKSLFTREEPRDIITSEDFQIGNSVGAKAKNYEVLDLATGERYQFAEGTKIQDAQVFAGKGVKSPFRKAEKYVSRYGGKTEEWQHAKGFGVLDTPDGYREAEVHWVQCSGIGKFEFFVKEWLD